MKFRTKKQSIVKPGQIWRVDLPWYKAKWKILSERSGGWNIYVLERINYAGLVIPVNNEGYETASNFERRGYFLLKDVE